MSQWLAHKIVARAASASTVCMTSMGSHATALGILAAEPAVRLHLPAATASLSPCARIQMQYDNCAVRRCEHRLRPSRRRHRQTSTRCRGESHAQGRAQPDQHHVAVNTSCEGRLRVCNTRRAEFSWHVTIPGVPTTSNALRPLIAAGQLGETLGASMLDAKVESHLASPLTAHPWPHPDRVTVLTFTRVYPPSRQSRRRGAQGARAQSRRAVAPSARQRSSASAAGQARR